MTDRIFIPVIRIGSGSVTTFSVPHERPRRTEKQEETTGNLTRGIFKGVISDKARRQVRKMAEGWLLSIQEAKKGNLLSKRSGKRYITFVTLTLSAKQEHDDNTIKRELLNKFIIYCQRKFKVQEYIWRAEAQANGNIHFHLFLDVYVNWRKLRLLWNQCQESLGYITRFRSIYGHNNPNSTDIERIRSVKGATTYVTKYIAKESKYRIIKGRLWGCSDGIRKIRPYEEHIDGRFQSLLNYLENEPTVKKVKEEHYSVFLGNIKSIIQSQFYGIASILKNHYQDTFRMVYSP